MNTSNTKGLIAAMLIALMINISLATTSLAFNLTILNDQNTDGVSLVSENEIKLEYNNIFLKLKDLVDDNYEPSWWKPSKDGVMKKIDKFLVEFDGASLYEYTADDIDELVSQVDKIKLLLSSTCYSSYEAVQINIASLSKKAKKFLDRKS